MGNQNYLITRNVMRQLEMQGTADQAQRTCVAVGHPCAGGHPYADGRPYVGDPCQGETL